MTRPPVQPQTLLRRCSNFCAALLLLGGLGACSAVPDAVNPVEWYRGVTGLFEDDDAQLERAQEQAARQTTPLPGTGKPYPNLATVPNRPQVTSAAERGKVAAGLAADRENARYAESGSPGAATVDPTPAAAVPIPSSVARPPIAAPAAPQPLPQQTAALPPVQPAQQPVQARESPMPVPTTPSGATFPLGMTQFATVFFANNSAALDAEGKRALRMLADGYKEQGGSLRIVGFASGQAATANAQIANFRVAGQRAEAVAQELARLGVPMNHMVISSGNAGAVDAALARRVEVSLDY